MLLKAKYQTQIVEKPKFKQHPHTAKAFSSPEKFVHILDIGQIPFQIIKQILVQRCETHMAAQSCKALYTVFDQRSPFHNIPESRGGITSVKHGHQKQGHNENLVSCVMTL